MQRRIFGVVVSVGVVALGVGFAAVLGRRGGALRGLDGGRYIHFSSRKEDPAVPPRSMEAFSGGTGPIGLYVYQEDATPTFGGSRKHRFIVEPTVDMLDTGTYTKAQLERDLAKISEEFDISRPLRLWNKLADRRELRNGDAPFAKLYYVLGHITRSTDPEDLPPSNQSTVADPVLARELLLRLGYKAIEDRRGMIYASEPEQAVFLTDDAFRVVKREQRTACADGRRDCWTDLRGALSGARKRRR